jgi:plasmid replication initiation protein
MPRKIKSRSIAMTPNKVIQAGQEMSLFQNKIFTAALARLEFSVNESGIKEDNVNREKEIDRISKKIYTINIEPLFDDFLGMKVSTDSNNLKYIEDKVESIVKQVLKIKEKGSLTVVNIIDYAHYEYGAKTIDVQFSRSIIPILIDMFEDGFTKIRIASMFKFRSVYSMRIYEELCRVKNMESVKKNGHVLTVYELFFMLGLDRSKEYKKYDHFKQRVLLTAQKEIKEKAKITFDFEEIRRGKPVYQIRFFNIKEEEQVQLQLPLFPDDDLVKIDMTPEDIQAQEFIEAVFVDVKEDVIEHTKQTTDIFTDTETKIEKIEQKPEKLKFTEEQLEILDKYLEGVFSADEIKSKYSFDYIEFYYQKAKELDEKSMTKNFPNFFYDMMNKDRHKFQELKTKEETKQKKELIRQKAIKEKQQREKELEENKKQMEEEECHRLENIFDNISDDIRNELLEKWYAENSFYKTENSEIFKFVKWKIAEIYEKNNKTNLGTV